MTSRSIRRSNRLLEAGYYKEDGTLNLSYKERIVRVFKRRPRVIYEDSSMSSYSTYGSNSSYSGEDGGNNYFGDYVQDFLQNYRNTSDDSEPTPLLVQDSETQTTWTGAQATLTKTNTTTKSSSSLWVKISCFFLMLLLNFGLTHVYVNFRVQEEFKKFQPREEFETFQPREELETFQPREELETFQPQDITFIPWSNTMANYALESQGARVLRHLSSDTYRLRDNSFSMWDTLTHFWCAHTQQRTVIQGHPLLNPGNCWPFPGEQGHLFISLSHPVHITHVTLGHITKRQSPSGNIQGAPREFSVYGFTTTDEEGVFLGRQVYNQDGEVYQTFEMPDSDSGAFRYVKLKIENNWGHEDYTCVYDFKKDVTVTPSPRRLPPPPSEAS